MTDKRIPNYLVSYGHRSSFELVEEEIPIIHIYIFTYKKTKLQKNKISELKCTKIFTNPPIGFKAKRH